MGELAFIGLGLTDERGLSARALEALKACDEVFAEEYTAVAPTGTLDRLSTAVGHPIRRLDRASLEAETPLLEALGRSPRVALLVVGDPFAATTHVALRIAAERAGHRWSYFPNASILTAAAGYLGLMGYRFGRTVSLPLPAEGFAPTSPVEQIAANRSRGLHTLVLLDLAPEVPRYLTAGDALRLLRERDPQARVLTEADLVAVAARVGRDDAAGFVGPFGRMRSADFGPPLHTVVVLAPELHFEEQAAMARFRIP
jgi:diphthine synthase